MADLSPQDGKLLEQCIAGDKKGWDNFVDRFSGLIHHYVRLTLSQGGRREDPEEVRDVAHTVFLSLLEHDRRRLRRFAGQCSLATWVRLIAVRTAIDHLRRERRAPSRVTEGEAEERTLRDMADDSPSAAELLENREERRILDEIRKDLTPRERLFVELYYRRELSPQEVARIMSCTMGAVYTMKNRVREKLKKAVSQIL